MPTFGAVLVASGVGWLVEASFDPWFGSLFAIGASFVVSTFAFYFARRALAGLVDGS